MPDHATKWFAFLAVKEGILTPELCREIHSVLGDDMELLLFAEVVVANEFGSTEDVQAIVNRAWKKAQNPLPPPKDVFAHPSSKIWGVAQDKIPKAVQRSKPKAAKKKKSTPSTGFEDTVEFSMDEELLPAESVEDNVMISPSSQHAQSEPAIDEEPIEIIEMVDESLGAEVAADAKPAGTPASAPKTVLKPLPPDTLGESESEDVAADATGEASNFQIYEEPDPDEVRSVASKTKEVLRSKILAALKKSEDTDTPPQLADVKENLERPGKGANEDDKVVVETSILDVDDVTVDFDGLGNLDRQALKMELVKLLKAALDAQASDLHLSAGAPPFVRKVDGISLLSDHVLSAGESQALNTALLTHTQEAFFMRQRDYDYALALDDDNRFRVNLMLQKDGLAGVYHLLPNKIKLLDDLGFKNAASIRKMLEQESGLIIVSGPANSGKTTTLAAMIAELNERRSDHIISIEEPVEVLHRAENCSVTQREVGVNTNSFQAGLTSALRQDAGIVVLGAVENHEIAELAVSAADTGRLVIAVIPAMSVASALNRLACACPKPQQVHLRATLAGCLRGVVCQHLIQNQQGGRTVACELLLNTDAVANLVRGGRPQRLRAIMETETQHGMCTLDQYVFSLFKDGVITEEVANHHITDRVVKNRLKSYKQFGDVSAQTMQGRLPGQGASKLNWGVFSDE